MKKPALIRSDKPHVVQVTEGSRVAQRSTISKKTSSRKLSDTPVTLENSQKNQLAQAPKPRKAVRPKAPAASVPTTPADASKATGTASPSKAKRKTALKKAVRKPRNKSPIKTPISTEGVLPMTPILPTWEQDNTVKLRIEELQTLNAQLTEQLQRLPSNQFSRGAKP